MRIGDGPRRLAGLWARVAGRAAARPMPAAGAGGARLSQRHGYRLQNSRFASSADGQTLASLIHLDAEPRWIRLLYVNDEPTPWTVDGAAVAVTAAVGDGVTALDADGRPAPEAWRRVTFDTAGRDVDPALEGPGTRTDLEIAGNPRESGRPVHAWSDWMPIVAAPRRDGPGFLIAVRTWSRGRIRFAASTGGPDPRLGRAHAGFAAEGEALDPATDASFARDDAVFACHGVQVLSPTPGATVIGIGDSIIHSSCTTGEMSGFGARACAMLSRPDRPVSYVNEGFPGRNSLGFSANGLFVVEAFRPQAAIIQCWTRNEAWTPAAADLAFARAMAVADAVRRNGGRPILTTAAPSFPGDPAAEIVRAASNARLRALGEPWSVLDIDALWGQGGTPNRYRRSFDAGDGLHPNDAACIHAATVLAPILERALGQA